MEWKRVHLLIFLSFLKPAFGYEGWVSQSVQPQSWSVVHKLSYPRNGQSSVSEAPVTGSIPVEEVASNMLAGKNPDASKSPLSPSQYVKRGFSSSYGSMSHTQSAPNVLDRISSPLQLQGSSSLNAQKIFNKAASGEGSYSPSALSSKYGSGLQSVSAPLSSTPVRGEVFSGSSSRSNLFFSPLDASGPLPGDQSSSNPSTSSQGSSGLKLGGTSSRLSTPSSSSTGSSSSYRHLSTSASTYQGSSEPQLAGGSSQRVSASGLLIHSPSTESQNTPGSFYAKPAASPIGFHQLTTGPSSYGQYTPSSVSRVGTQLAASHYVPRQDSSSASSVQPQGTTSQHAPAFYFGAKQPVSSQYSKVTPSGYPSPSQSSPKWQPSTSRTQGFQTVSGTGTSWSTSWPNNGFSSLSSTGGSVQSQPASSQKALASLDARVPEYSQTASSASSAPSQTSQLDPFTSRWSQGFQTSGAVASHSSSPSQGSSTSKSFTLTSAASPSQFASKQEGSGTYSGLSIQSPSTSSLHSPGSSEYAKLATSTPSVSLLTSGESSYSQYTSSSWSRAGTQLAGSSHHAPVQTGSLFTGGSSLQKQGTSLYAPPHLDVKMPMYSQVPSVPSRSLSQPIQWQPSSSLSKAFQTSGTVASQSNSQSQGPKAPTVFSTSARSSDQFASPQEGIGSYSDLSKSALTLTSPESPTYIRRGSSVFDVSRKSSSGFSTHSMYTSSSQSRDGTQLADPIPSVPVQSVSTSTDGSYLQLPGTSSQYAPLPLSATVHVYSNSAPSGTSSKSQPSQWQTSARWPQGFQTSGAFPLQSGSSSQSLKAPSRFSTQASPGSSLTGSEASKKWQPSASPWSKRFQASGTAESQSSPTSVISSSYGYNQKVLGYSKSSQSSPRIGW
ncbi:serine-rich adhesin for platelets [Carassius gibelio]|uniref:serine-rich adhesin for platelets n=1 Tax=Carassius gibelio TaxID=101364 RepID=UPI0022797510|nr:serine-rich adhesin for platelets [Carassius gibelio]